MKKITFFLFLFASIIANAQDRTVTGQVVDEMGQGMPGVSVLIKGTTQGQQTDFDGNFRITTPLNATLEFRFLGYKSVLVNVSQNTSVLKIKMVPSTEILDEVLVKSVRATSAIPVTFTNFSKEEIAKRNLGQDIPVLLNYLPSVVSSSDAGAGVGYTYLSVRGSNSERINVTINGIPYNDAESHGTFWVNLGDFASSTENLQLQRGVGTSTNGSGAFGASLNILTDAISEEAYGEISNSLGSFNTRKHTVKFSTGKLNDHFEISGRFSNSSFRYSA